MHSHLIVRAILIAWCFLLALPVVSVLAAWLAFDAAALAVLQHQFETVLAGYALQSLLLALGVALGTAALGVATAVAVTLFRFPGRGFFEWALLLPMAMPAYVLAYAATDALQPSGLCARPSAGAAPSGPTCAAWAARSRCSCFASTPMSTC
jgi:iron(III) transport system permease protein